MEGELLFIHQSPAQMPPSLFECLCVSVCACVLRAGCTDTAGAYKGGRLDLEPALGLVVTGGGQVAPVPSLVGALTLK